MSKFAQKLSAIWQASLNHSFRQLVKEFWFPLITAISWTFFDFFELPKEQRSASRFVNVFGPAFFLVSWAISQWFRVQKQQKIDKGINSIEISVNRALSEIETRTNDILSSITGGESACYIFGSSPTGNIWEPLLAVHIGKHPLYEVHVRIVDLEILEEMRKNNEPPQMIDRSNTTLTLGGLTPNMARITPLSINLGTNTSRNFNLFFTARNGTFEQYWRCRKVNDKWLLATRLLRNGVVLFERIDENHPFNQSKVMDWHNSK